MRLNDLGGRVTSRFIADTLEPLVAFPVELFCGLIAGHGKGVYIERGEVQTRLE